MSRTRTIFLPRTRYAELMRLAEWYLSTPPELLDCFCDTLTETIRENLDQLVSEKTKEDLWYDGWRIRRGTLYVSRWSDARETQRVRFAPVRATTRRGRRYSNRLMTPKESMKELAEFIRTGDKQ